MPRRCRDSAYARPSALGFDKLSLTTALAPATAGHELISGNVVTDFESVRDPSARSTTLDNDIAFADTIGATRFGFEESQEDLISYDL